MSEISRIITNLGIAYGLGSKEQFIDAISKYAQDKEMDDEAVRDLIEQVFEELELTNRKRKAKQVNEVIDLEERASFEEKEEGTAEPVSNKTEEKLEEVVSEIRALRRSVETLIDTLNKK